MKKLPCEMIPALALGSLLTLAPAQVTAADALAEGWCPPVKLDPLNSDRNDNGPELAAGDRALYFGSARAGGDGQGDLYASRRETGRDGWTEPENLDRVHDSALGVNTDAVENAPALCRGGHVLFFSSDRPVKTDVPFKGTGCGPSGAKLDDRSCDIWFSERTHTQDDQGWSEPVNLRELVNGALINEDEYAEVMGDTFEDDDTGVTEFYFTSGRKRDAGDTTEDHDVYVSRIAPGGGFGAPVLVGEVSRPDAEEQRVAIGPDGLTMLFQSNRTGSVGPSMDLWISTRKSTGVGDPWSEPVNLGPVVNSPLFDGGPRLSSDGRTLYFFSGPPGNVDLFTSVRACGDGS